MSKLCNVQVHINGQETFFLNEKILLTFYSDKLRKIVLQETKMSHKKKIHNKMITMSVEIDDFPGGPQGFETVSRLCHGGGSGSGSDGSQTTAAITVSNVALLYSGAIFVGMTKDHDLLRKTEAFLEGASDWSWKELVSCLESCSPIHAHVRSNGLLDRLVSSLSAKVGQGSDSSPANKPRWFDELIVLPPKIVERVIDNDSSGGASLTLTKFLLHYLKQQASGQNRTRWSKSELLGLANTAASRVLVNASNGTKSFSCRSLFWVLRLLSGFGISKATRGSLEKLVGEALDESSLDDLLVSGRTSSSVYDVDLVIRLVGVFFANSITATAAGSGGASVQKLTKVGRLVDQYLGEISPDHNLKVSKFLGVAQSVPDSARHCFDRVYRAIDIYLQSHSALSSRERSRLCGCLNFEKLSLETCKELAKNPKIPPRITMQALISQQQSKTPTKEYYNCDQDHGPIASPNYYMAPKMAMYSDDEGYVEPRSNDVKMNLQRMQNRVVELEKICREIKGQMSRMVRHNNICGTPTHSKALPKFC